MDTSQLLSDAKARFNHLSAKKYLNDKYQSKLTIANQGGLWLLSTDLLALLNSSTSPSLILIDQYNNPVEVDRLTLLSHAEETYNKVMTDWLTELNELSKKR